MKELKEYCGVFGISCNDLNYSIAEQIYHGLMAIQHRGQIFAGISVSNCKDKIYSYRNKGLVSKVLTAKKLKFFTGNVGIGHVCYGFPKNLDVKDAQPYHFKSEQIDFSISMNGMITNYKEIQKKLEDTGRIFESNSDVELLSVLIETISKSTSDIVETLKLVMSVIKGSYSFVLLTPDGNLYAMRDPSGFKPLCFGEINRDGRKFYVVSSESCALDVLGVPLVDDVKPGEIVKIDPVAELKRFQGQIRKRGGICQFEFTYFARPDSIIDGRSVAEVRYNLGRNLAREENLKLNGAIVVPVPDSGRSAAIGYAWEAGLSYEEGLMKNRYIWQLKSTANEKLNPIKSLVKDKDIVLIDDTIISGITLKQIISMLRDSGARSIHVRISAPPIINSCKINESMLTNKAFLIAYEKKLNNYDNFNEEMRQYINADTLKYQTIEALINAIGLKENQICYSCLKEYCVVEEDEEKSETSQLSLIF